MKTYLVTSCYWNGELQEYIYECVKVKAYSEFGAILKSGLTGEIVDIKESEDES